MSIEFNYTRLQDIKDKTNKAFNNILKNKIAQDAAIAQAIKNTTMAQTENLNLKTQLQSLETKVSDITGNLGENIKIINVLASESKDTKAKVDAIVDHLELDFVKEVGISHCFDKLDSHLVSYSNDTCSLYPECA